jgi:hypothetical protein
MLCCEILPSIAEGVQYPAAKCDGQYPLSSI